MKNLLVVLGLCALVATETQAAKGGSACLQENGRFTYDHPIEGELTDLTQAGLDLMNARAGESITSAANIRNCPKKRVSMVSSVKKWFKQFAASEEQPTGPSTLDGKSKHTAKSGDFEALLIMTQDSQSILTGSSGMTFTMFEDVARINIGEGIEALLLTRGCSANSNGDCLVKADYVIEAPDGSTYQEALNTDVWKEAKPPLIQYNLTNERIGFLLQSDADPGLYTVSVTVSDRISNTEVLVSGKVMANAIMPEDKEKTQVPLEDITNPWHDTSSSKGITINTE